MIVPGMRTCDSPVWATAGPLSRVFVLPGRPARSATATTPESRVGSPKPTETATQAVGPESP
jgi:hypothetical protein